MIDRLKVKNFRGFDSFDVQLQQKNSIVGINGSGKTTLLEAIYYVCLNKSFRTQNNQDLISIGETFFDISIYSKGNEYLRIFYNNELYSKKHYYVNGLKHFWKSKPNVLKALNFSSSVLHEFTNKASVRRLFLDHILSQLSQEYGTIFSEFEKIYVSKNRLLKMIRSGSDEKQLDFYNEKFIRISEKLYNERAKFVDIINCFTYNDKFFVKYIQVSNIDKLKNELKYNKQKEIILGKCLYGPQKDDYHIYFKNKNINNIASRGESKMALLFFLFRVSEYFFENLLDTVILIDDLEAELDDKNSENVYSLINSEINSQIFITSLKQNDRYSNICNILLN